MTDAEIPTEALPKGWVSTGRGFAFEHQAAGVTVRADRRPADADTEVTGSPGAWRVWYERRVGEATERRTVGKVTTLDAAIDGLLSCMRLVSDGSAPRVDGRTAASDSAADWWWTPLSALAADVSLRDAIPTTADGDTPVDEASYARAWTAKLDADT